MHPISKLGRRCLFPLEKEFLPKLKEWRNAQIEVLRQLKPLTDYDQEKWFQQISEDDKQVLFVIMVSEQKQKKMKLIGYCGIVSIDYKNRRGEISFLVEPGRASDNFLYKKDFLSVLYMLCEYGFGALNLNKIYTETFSFRKKHLSILEEFGFHLDGSLREHHFTSGRYYDSLIHSMLVSEWRKKKGKIKSELEE